MSDPSSDPSPCPNCGEAVTAGDAFCEACGQPLDGAPPPAETPIEGSRDAPAEPVTRPTGASGSAGASVMAKGLAAAAVARATARAAGAAAPGPVEAAPAPTVGEPPADAGSNGVACPSCGTAGQWFDDYCGICGRKRPDRRDHTERDLPGVAAVSDKGLRHARNEDAYAVATGDGFVVAVVCDGVSTTVLPETASQVAADASAAHLLATASTPGGPDFDGAFDAAREAVLAIEFAPHAHLGPPACTYLAAVVTDSAYRLHAFGDCRAYWIEPDGAAHQLTTDDSWATHQIAAGMTPAEAFADNRAHAITRWLARDADPSWRPAPIEFVVPGPGRAVLVSDGVWNYAAEPHQLTEVVRDAPPTALGLARHLVDFANQGGGSDNITAVVVDLPLQPGNPEAP